MNCKKLLTKLFEVIDKEADRADKETIEKHLKDCECCMSRYQFEKMFKHFVLEKSGFQNCQTDHNVLKRSILDQIDKIDDFSC